MGNMNAAVEHLLEHRCSRQWRGFLGAMAAEFEAQLSVDDLRRLIQRVGARFAEENPLPHCVTLDDVCVAANRVWETIDWGYVDMREEEGALILTHHCAPLQTAFGRNALAWTPAYIEGVYGHWFASVGATKELVVRQASECDAMGTVECRLSI